MTDERFYRELGRRIAHFRRDNKLTQEQLAERARIGASYVARIESGVRKPTLDALRRIASGVGARVEELFVAPGVLRPDEKAWRAQERRVAEGVRALSSDDVELLARIIERLRRAP